MPVLWKTDGHMEKKDILQMENNDVFDKDIAG